MGRDPVLFNRLPLVARVLLLAAAPPRESVDDDLRALLKDKALDWQRFIALAERERASGVAWRRIKQLAPEDIPPQVASDFERLAMIADFTASYLCERLSDAVLALQRVGIEPILLKGAALAPTAYASFFERPMGDIDLLVESGRAEEAWRLLQKAGWRWLEEENPLEHYLGHHHLPPLMDASGTNVRLELHASLFVAGNPFAIDRKELMVGARRVRIGKCEAWVPSPENLLLHACIHFAWSHMLSFGSWRAFKDVIALSGTGLDWRRFAQLAEENRAQSSCYWTLRLAERLMGASIPEATIQRLERGCDRRWINVVERHVVSELYLDGQRCPSQWVRRRFWETAIRPIAAGHGAIRPWILDETLNDEVPATIGGVQKAARQLSRIGDWWRYARVLAG